MRKRQWKKILSVVLALAMVFSMNVSAFADEVTDPVAVEEPAAEEPAPAAEAEEPAAEEEPAPAAEEPAAEEAAPVEEAAPETKEEAAGADIETTSGVIAKLLEIGWTLDTLANDGDIVCTEDGLTVTAKNGAGDVALTPITGESYPALTLNGTSLDPTDVITVEGINTAAEDKAAVITVGDGAADNVIVKSGSYAVSADLATGALVVGDGSTTKLAAGTYHIFKPQNLGSTIDYSDEELDTTSSFIVAKGSDLAETVDDAEGSRDISAWIPAYGSSDETAVVKDATNVQYELITIPDRQDKPAEVVESSKTNNTIVVTGDSSVEVGYKIGAGDFSTANVTEDPAGVYTITSLAGGKTYTVAARTPATVSEFASEWTTGIPVTTEADPPTPGNVFTVSGFTFTMTNTVSAISYPKGVAEVAFTASGDDASYVYIEKTGSPSAISLNVAGDVDAVFDSSVDDYKYFSVLGGGTIYTDGVTAAGNVYAKAFEKVEKNVKISSNSLPGILVSENNAAYWAGISDIDEAYTVVNDSKVVVVRLNSLAEPKKVAGKLDPDNLLFGASEQKEEYILSENRVEFTHIPDAAAAAKVKVSENQYEGISVKFGPERLIIVDNPASLAGAKVLDIPEQGVSKWELTRLEGMATNTGVDISIYNSGENKKNRSKYEFTISTNSGAEKTIEDWVGGAWTPGTAGIITTQIDGTGLEEDTTYYLYVRKLADEDYYKSKVVGSMEFKTLKKVTISLNLANKSLSPNYIGDATGNDELKKLADNTNVINRNFFDFTLHGFSGLNIVDGYKYKDLEGTTHTDNYNNNVFTMIDDNGFVYGTLTLHFGQYTNNNPADINWDTGFFSTARNYYELPVNNITKPYAAWVQFTPDANAPVPYNAQNDPDDSGLVSFNVIKTPVKFAPVLSSPVAVSGSDIATKITRSYTKESMITGKTASSVAGDPKFYINGLEAKDAASWNNLKPGTYTISINQGTIDDPAGNYEVVASKGADYSATTTLTVVDPKSTDGLKVSGKFINWWSEKPQEVYYGESIADVKSSISANFTFGGVDVTDGDQWSYDGSVTILKSPSNNVAKATDKVTDMSTISANTKLYAYFVDVYQEVGGENLGPVSSDAIEFTVQPRPVEVGLKDASKKPKSYRGDKLQTSVSTADLVVDPCENWEGDIYYPDYTLGAIKADDFFTKNSIDLDTSNINPNKPGDYKTTLKGYTLSSNKTADYAKNFVVADDFIPYKIQGKWYVKYILEYGGRGAKAGQRYVSSDEVIVEAEDGSKNRIGDPYKITPSSRLTNSWNNILPEGDTITKWEIKNADTLRNVYYDEYDGQKPPVATGINTDDPLPYNYTAEVILDDYDYAVYAVVAAKATEEGVMVESIAPVRYDGRAHVNLFDDKATTTGDLTVTVYDEKKFVGKNQEYEDKWGEWSNDGKIYTYRKYLTQGEDYTITYKNNKNASVAYDETVSGDTGTEATIKRIVDDKKMPQVIIKGKGDYKSLKTTVLFDILPVKPATWDVTGEPAEYQFVNKNLNTKSVVTHTIVKDDEKGTTKVYKLKAGKASAKSKSGYTGDYILDVYKVEDNGARAKITNFKKIAKGNYELVYRGVNNYAGIIDNVWIHVVEGNLLSKQTIKTKKKIDWKKDLKASEFITLVKAKKAPKAEIPFIGVVDSDTKAGYYILGVDDLTGGDIDYDDNGVPIFKDAGKYTITIAASTALGKTSQIFGSHTITVEVKGKKLKASDFTIDGTSAKKTVIVKYDGKDKMVEVKLAKPANFPETDGKIPTAIPSVKKQATNKNDAVDAVENDGIGNTYNGFNEDTGAYNGGYSSSIENFYDTGVRMSAVQTGKNVYTVSPKAFNSSLYPTYAIKIKPSGKYYAGTESGYLTLTYKRGGLDLSKIGEDIFKVTAPAQKLNINGTPAELIFKIAGMEPTGWSSVTVSGDLTNNYNASTKKSYVLYDSKEILEVTYAKNTKVGNATATIKPTKFGKKYFSKSKKVTYKIEPKPVKVVGTYDVNTLTNAANNGEVFAVVTDAVKPRNGNAKLNAVLYQVDAYGATTKKLGGKDYKVSLGEFDKGGAKTGYEVNVSDGTSGNFKFDPKLVVTGSYFNVYDAKSKVQVTLSQGEASGYDAAKKGYVYTGKAIQPTVTSITYGGQTYTFPGGLETESSNFAVVYKDNTRVGTATATITLKRDVDTKDLSANKAYPYGGSVTVKFKIVPHTNENLILSE